MALAHNPKIVTDGLVLCLDAANPKSYPGTGTTWKDLSGNGNDGTLVNGVGYSSDNKGAMVFDGVDDHSVNESFSLGISDPTVTINGWCRRTALNTNGRGWWGIGSGSSSRGINNYMIRSNKVSWDLWGRTTFDTGQDYPLNEWVNVCWVKNAPTFTPETCLVFINGINFPIIHISRNNSTFVNLNSGQVLGRVGHTVNQYHGQFDIGLFSIYNRALTPEEIQQNFQATRGRYGI